MNFPAKAIAFASLLLGTRFPTAAPSPPETTSDLFNGTNIWSVHLKFTPQQWAAMEPRQTGDGFGFGGFRGGGRGGFGMNPGSFLAPAFLRDGDQDRDGQLSREEFTALSQKWFTNWDHGKSGKITADETRSGLAATLQASPGARPARTGLQGPEGKRNGVASRAGYEFDYVHGQIDFQGKSFPDVAVRYKGNGSFLRSQRSGLDKRSFKMDLNKFVKGQKLAGVTTLNLHSDVLDASWMNESVSYRLYSEAGVPAPRTAYARVNVTAGTAHKNEYFGLYSLVENIEEKFAERRFKVEGGAIFKPVTPDLFADLGGDWASYKQTYDPKTDLTKDQSARVMEMCRFVTKATDEEFAARLGEFLDLDAFARYLAVTVWVTDLDGILGPGQNYYLYLHPKTRQFHFIAWDQDNSFGQMRGTQEEREQLSIDHPWQGENRFLERVFKVEAFKKAYHARMSEFSATLFKADRFHKQVDELGKILRPAVAEESSEKAQRFDEAVAGRASQDYGFRPFGGGKPIKGFVDARERSIREQLAGKSDGLRIEGRGFGRGGRGQTPGMFLEIAFMRSLDANDDGQLTQREMRQGFGKWFESWNTNRNGVLSESELQNGIARDLASP